MPAKFHILLLQNVQVDKPRNRAESDFQEDIKPTLRMHQYADKIRNKTRAKDTQLQPHSAHLRQYIIMGVKTLRTQDTSDPRHFGTSAEVSVRQFGTSAELSGHFGTSAEVSERHFGTSADTSALRKTLRHHATMDGKVDG